LAMPSMTVRWAFSSSESLKASPTNFMQPISNPLVITHESINRVLQSYIGDDILLELIKLNLKWSLFTIWYGCFNEAFAEAVLECLFNVQISAASNRYDQFGIL
jgi:hypothetical protein